MEKVFFGPNADLSKKITQLNTQNKLNDFVKSGLGVPFDEIIKIFSDIYGERKIINANQIIVPSIDQCVRNLFSNKLSQSLDTYSPLSITYLHDIYKGSNPEKFSYFNYLELGKNNISYKKTLDNPIENAPLSNYNDTIGFWSESIGEYNGFNIGEDISVFFDKVTRFLLEKQRERLGKGDLSILLDVKIEKDSENFYLQYSKKKGGYSTKKVPDLEDYTSVDELLNNKNIKFSIPAKIYYPYIYLPLTYGFNNFIVDYELDGTGLLDSKKIKELFSLSKDTGLGLVDLGKFYEGSKFISPKFKTYLENFLQDMVKNIEDKDWLAISSVITPEVYNNVFNGLEQIKLTTPKQTAKDILGAIEEELVSIL